METLEPNMYVRTKKSIGKVYQICKNEKNEDGTIYNKFILNTNDRLEICDTDLVVKASHNIVDLIECGDYINGHLVTKISKDGFVWLEGYSDNGTWRYVDFINEWGDNIKSIVTKEQFESMKYEVK